jgi:hypothetical protein
VDPLKGEMAFIRESTGVTKSTRGIKSAREAKEISHSKGVVFFFEEDEEKTLRAEVAIQQNDLLRANTQLGSPPGVFRRALDNSLQGYSFQAGETGDVRRGEVWMEIKLDRKDSEKEENREGRPRGPSDSFQKE